MDRFLRITRSRVPGILFLLGSLVSSSGPLRADVFTATEAMIGDQASNTAILGYFFGADPTAPLSFTSLVAPTGLSYSYTSTTSQYLGQSFSMTTSGTLNAAGTAGTSSGTVTLGSNSETQTTTTTSTDNGDGTTTSTLDTVWTDNATGNWSFKNTTPAKPLSINSNGTSPGSGGAGSFATTLSAAAVPEPSVPSLAAALAAIGLGYAICHHRKRYQVQETVSV